MDITTTRIAATCDPHCIDREGELLYEYFVNQ